jgi:hypothetical protein
LGSAPEDMSKTSIVAIIGVAALALYLVSR